MKFRAQFHRSGLWILLATSLGMACQSSLPNAQPRTEKPRTDGDQMLEAGRSGNRQLIPLIREHLASSQTGSAEAEKSLMALAHLGEKQEQQQFVCSLYAADRQKMKLMIVNDIPYIGGWFAIQMYRELLSPQARMRYYVARKETSDGQFSDAGTGPRLWSLSALPQLMSNPPIGAPSSSASKEELQRDAQIWRDWIKVNQSTLQKIEPSGQGIDFSGQSCQKQAVRVPQATHP